MNSTNLKSVGTGAASYLLWGLLPLYWKLLAEIPALEVLCHRICWSAAFLSIIVLGLKPSIFNSKNFHSPIGLALYFLSSILLAGNWILFIWAVQNGLVLQSSLGYFIAPLTYVVLGVLFLGEKLSRIQGLVVVLMFLALANQILLVGSFPWVALGLALTISFYGLIRKVAPLSSLAGLSLETLLMTTPALIFLLLATKQPTSFQHASGSTQLFLILTGPVTAIPLLLYASAARSLSLKSMGMLQYISPACQFLIAVLVFKEAFSRSELVSFGFIWLGLALYLSEQILERKARGSRHLAERTAQR